MKGSTAVQGDSLAPGDIANYAQYRHVKITPSAGDEPITPSTKYEVTVIGSEAADSGAGAYDAGAVVTLNAGTKSGYVFGGWTANSGDVSFADAAASTTTFTMPAGAVQVTANWKKLHTVTVVGSNSSSNGAGNYAAGQTVTVYVGNVPNSPFFTAWTTDGTDVAFRDPFTANGASFTMPDRDVTVTAHWSDETATYKLTINGGGTGATATKSYTAGTPVWPNPGTKTGYTFTGWSVTTGAVKKFNNPTSSTQAYFSMPPWDVTLTANWDGQTYRVTIENPPGNYITEDHVPGATVTLNAGTREGYTFVNWEAPNGNVSINNPTLPNGATFIMPNNPSKAVYIVANWKESTPPEPVSYKVTVANSYAANSGSGNYTEGKTVQLDAGTRDGCTFAGWTVTSGGAVLNDASSAQTTFTMPAENVAVTANWRAVPAAHTVTITGGGASTTGAGSYNKGSTVTVSAGARAGYTFAGWAVISPVNQLFLSNPGNTSISFTMPDTDVELLAAWTPLPDANGVLTLCLDELYGDLVIEDDGYRCGEPNIKHSFSGPYILTQQDPSTPTPNTVTVTSYITDKDYDITLDGVNIAADGEAAAFYANNNVHVQLTLRGNNTLTGGTNHAGLELTVTGSYRETTVTITGTGQDTLTATGGDYGAGIGGGSHFGYGVINIAGGTITAAGGKGAAGIGGGNTYKNGGTGAGGSGTVNITGGAVTATGTADSGTSATGLLGAAGIGAGYGAASYPDNGPDSTINISGGMVTAIGVGKAPCIGGTYTGRINISGGTVTTRRGDNASTAEIGKEPTASGGICEIYFCDKPGLKTGNAQIFVSGPNAISNKPASPSGSSNYYWHCVVYEGNSGQLYCANNAGYTVEWDSLTVPAGKTLNLPEGVVLKVPQSGLHADGASFSGKGRVAMDGTYYYAKANGTLTPCEAQLILSGGSEITILSNTLEDIITGKVNPGLVYDGNRIRLLTDVDYPGNIVFEANTTRCTGLELDLNGKTLNMGSHTIRAEVAYSDGSEDNTFTISDSAGGGKITGSSAQPLILNDAGRLVIAGGTIENTGTGPAVQISSSRAGIRLSGGTFSKLLTTANQGFTPTPLVELLGEGYAFRGSRDQLWISPASKRSELCDVTILPAPAGLPSAAAVKSESRTEVSVSGLADPSGATYQWLARSYEGGEAAVLPGATGAVLYLTDGTLEAGAYYASCQVTVNGVTVLTNEVYVEATAPAVILTVAEGTCIYDGTAHRPAVSVTAKDGTLLVEGTDYTLTYEDNVEAGTAKAVVQGTDVYPFEPVRKTFQIEQAALTVQAQGQTIRQGEAIQTGVSMAAARGLVSGDLLAEITLVKSGDQILPSGAKIQNAAGKDVTTSYVITYQSGTLTVTAGSSGDGGSGGGVPQTGSSVTTGTSTQDGTPVTETTVTLAVNTQDGKATTAVSAAVGNELVRQAAANNSETVVITSSPTGNVTKTEVTIPAATVGQLGSQTSASLTVSTPIADVTIPNQGLTSLSDAGGAVTIATEQSNGVVELSIQVGDQTVARIPSGVTLTVPMEATTPGTVAVLIHEDGIREVVRKSVTDGDSITIPLDGSARLEIVDNRKSFVDVPATGWEADTVAFVSAHELFNGTGDGQFSPDLPMSRGMLTTVLHNLERNPAQTVTGVFADVSDGTWYSEGVVWAASQGIVTGYGDGDFGPEDPITREQLAIMLWRYAGRPMVDGHDLDFTDMDEASSYAMDALRWAAEKHIISGDDDGQLYPQGPVTRMQAAQMLKKFMEG